MELIMILLIFIGYFSISSKLDKIILKQDNKNKEIFNSFNELVGKNIKIEFSDEDNLIFGSVASGKLREYNDKWIVLENVNKKGIIELFYYRINNIVSIEAAES